MDIIKKMKIVFAIVIGCLVVSAIPIIIISSIEYFEYNEMLEADKEDGNYKIKQNPSILILFKPSVIILTDNKTGDDVSHLCTVEIWILENDYEPHLIGIANEMEINMMREKTFCIIIDPDGVSIWKTDFINFTCSMEDNYRFYITVYRK